MTPRKDPRRDDEWMVCSGCDDEWVAETVPGGLCAVGLCECGEVLYRAVAPTTDGWRLDRRSSLTAAAVVLALLVWSVWWAATLPTVYRVWLTGECRAVVPAGDCATPPRIHKPTVWVSPDWTPPERRPK